jgi:uncharacterized glyoxalase superfamily protein PhnB
MSIRANRLTPLLQVFDMRKSVAWYCDILGCELLQKHEPDGHLYWAMLKLDQTVLMLNARYEDDQRPATAPAVERGDMTLYFACPDVDAAYAALLAKGAKVDPPKVTYYGMKQMLIRDLDGFELCFQQPA